MLRFMQVRPVCLVVLYFHESCMQAPMLWCLIFGMHHHTIHAAHLLSRQTSPASNGGGDHPGTSHPAVRPSPHCWPLRWPFQNFASLPVFWRTSGNKEGLRLWGIDKRLTINGHGAPGAGSPGESTTIHHLCHVHRPVPTARHPLQGLWKGDYGPNGIQVVQIMYDFSGTAARLVATKVWAQRPSTPSCLATFDFFSYADWLPW